MAGDGETVEGLVVMVRTGGDGQQPSRASGGNGNCGDCFWRGAELLSV